MELYITIICLPLVSFVTNHVIRIIPVRTEIVIRI